VSENRVLRRIFGPKRDGMVRDWRKLYSEELHNLYSPPKCNWIDQVKEEEMGKECSTHMGALWSLYRLLAGKHERHH
jgi:hypothetical protein